jgi:hypothetical protein
VRTDKVFPTRGLLPLGSRQNIMAAKNIAHRLTPPGIFLRHPYHQPLVNSGTTPEFAKLRSVKLVGDKLHDQELVFEEKRLCN